MTFEPVDPTKPALPYIGGKARLAKRLIAAIETIPHKQYAEPFVGMGGVFFRRRTRPPYEVINDLSGDVSSFFRVVQRHFDAFVDQMQLHVSSRHEFERLKRVDPGTLTDIERAARFFYLQLTGYGGLRVGGMKEVAFAVRPMRAGRVVPDKVRDMVEGVHRRLNGVTIESLPFDNFMRRYDRPGTLFFIDPPYWGIEGLYGTELFSRDDYQILVSRLKSIEGEFILTINDRMETRQLFAEFHVLPIEFPYTVGHAVGKELLVSSVPLQLAL